MNLNEMHWFIATLQVFIFKDGMSFVLGRDRTNSDRTAEIAANAPRYRRKSSTFIDAIHDIPHGQDLAPAQLYSTMSGRLFHSGRIAIVMVGPPARGKTYVPLARYCSTLTGLQTYLCLYGSVSGMAWC